MKYLKYKSSVIQIDGSERLPRLQMDTGELDLKIHEAEAFFKRQLITELRDVRERLRELDVTLPSARKVRAAKLQQVGGAEAARSISVTRARDGEATVFQATETTSLDPGDVIDVKRLLPHEIQDQSASAGQSGFPPDQMRAAGRQEPVASVSR